MTNVLRGLHPTPRPLVEVFRMGRDILKDASPPASFREALGLYRQIQRGGSVFFRCTFRNSNHEERR